MNILLKFQDNTKDVVSVKLRQKINILDQFLFKKYQDFKNNNSITYNYISIDDKTKMLANNVLNKQKTFQSQGILKNSTIHVNIDLNTVFIEQKKEAFVDTLVSTEDNNFNTRNTNTNSEIISTLKNMGFSEMDDETINALIDTCKAQKNVNEITVQDILEFLT